jgi:predicted P-loop ATPase
LKTYCGASEESEEYLTRVSRCWTISLVARGLQPGCKVDNVLVLQGVGGLGKSTAFSIFGGEWFCDTAISLGDKDSRMMAGQYWICEMAEIVAFKKTGHDTLKSFFSSSVDRFRPPYAAAFEESPRRCIWVGTTNDDDFLVDETGNRKYWPVICKYIEGAMELLKQDRDQLLAEAVAAFKAGEKWHFDYKDIAITEAETERHMIETPTKSLVASWWYGMTKSERPRSMTTAEVAMMAFDCNPSQLLNDRGLLKSIGMTMAKMGFKRRRDTSGARVWRLYPTEELLNAERVEVKRGNLFVIPGGKRDDDKK